MKEKESLEVMVARIDERVKHIPQLVKKVNAHDRDIIVAKVLVVLVLAALATKYPVIAEAVSNVVK